MRYLSVEPKDGTNTFGSEMGAITCGGRAYLRCSCRPRINLFPETATILLGRDVTGLPMNPLTRKVVIPLAPRECHRVSAPLEAIYVIAAAKPSVRRVAIRRLTRRQALVEILRNT